MRGNSIPLLAIVLIVFSVTVWLGFGTFSADWIPFFRGASFSDLLVTHIPNALFIRRSIGEWGQIPLWNTMILSGTPFAADPLAGIWYPLNWLAVLLPVGLGYNLFFWLHLIWAGVGVWQLSRAEGVSQAGALFAGLAFSSASKVFAHIGLGHVGLVAAVSWMPWVLLVTNKATSRQKSDPRSSIRYPALSGVLIGLIFVIDPRWALPTLALTLAYLTYLSFGDTEARFETLSLLKLIAVLVFFVVIASAILSVPLFELSVRSTRWGLSPEESTNLSMPFWTLLGLFIPLVTQPEWIVFIGTAVLLLAVSSLLRSQGSTRFWMFPLLISLVLSLGSYTFIYPALVKLIPGLNLLRIPPRLMFILLLAAAMLAGVGLDSLLSQRKKTPFQRWFRLLIVGVGSLVIALSISYGFLDPNIEAWQLVNLVFPVGLLFWAILSSSELLSDRVMVAGWFVFLVAQAAWVNGHYLERKFLPTQLSDRSNIIDIMADPDEMLRLFSPSYSVPQQVAAQYGLQLADGVNPLQLRAYYQYMATATGFDPQGYSVTLPPFPSGDPGEDWGFSPDIDRLQHLNVGWIVSDYPVESTGLIPMESVEGSFLYALDKVRSRAWIEQEDGSLGPTRVVFYSPNRIEIHGKGPGRLVLSEMDYPGWKAEIDGSETTTIVTDGIFRTVVIPAGEHEVSFVFQPLTVWIGAVISTIGLLGLAVIWRYR